MKVTKDLSATSEARRLPDSTNYTPFLQFFFSSLELNKHPEPPSTHTIETPA